MKKIFTMFLLMSFLLSFSVAFADSSTTVNPSDVLLTETTTTTTTTEATKIEDTLLVENEVDDIVDGGVAKNVSFEEIKAKIEKKLYDIVHALKIWSQPLAVIAFIAGIVMIIFGALGNHGLMGKGFVVLILVVLAYFGILYADSILSSSVAWLKE